MLPLFSCNDVFSVGLRTWLRKQCTSRWVQWEAVAMPESGLLKHTDSMPHALLCSLAQTQKVQHAWAPPNAVGPQQAATRTATELLRQTRHMRSACVPTAAAQQLFGKARSRTLQSRALLKMKALGFLEQLATAFQ